MRGMKAADLAKELGISKASVSLWLSSSTKELSAKNALLAAEVLNIDPYWLVFGKGSAERQEPVKLNSQEIHMINTMRSLDQDSQDLATRLVERLSA